MQYSVSNKQIYKSDKKIWVIFQNTRRIDNISRPNYLRKRMISLCQKKLKDNEKD
jgi:hypothetical protein